MIADWQLSAAKAAFLFAADAVAESKGPRSLHYAGGLGQPSWGPSGEISLIRGERSFREQREGYSEVV